MKPNSRIYMIGDVHGKFGHILPAIEKSDPGGKAQKAAIFLGDIESRRPFEEEIRPLLAAGIEVWLIHGNHDSDHPRSWDHLQSSWHRNLHGRVVSILGVRVAGLGGIFRGAIWYPRFGYEQPSFNNIAQYQRASNTRAKFAESLARKHAPDSRSAAIQSMRTSLDLTHQSTIFYDDWIKLSAERADMLVTHEAPHCHPFGFMGLTDLARAMRVKSLFHGHHHDNLDYRRFDDELGFRVFGVGLRGIKDASGIDLVKGEQDAQRMHRLPPK